MRYLFLLLIGLLSFVIHAQDQQSNKKHVCTITINSSDEKNVMKKSLPSRDFEFIELLPSDKKSLTKADSETDGIPEWLNDACNKKTECDMLVLSGHFGGTFFGSSGYRLSLEQIERAACKPECAGIFKKPKETFLFGCNTLAGKKPDKRTPEEYLQVLLDDHFARSDAEAAVAMRYSPWGNENLQRMQGVFSGTAKIYGFDSVGPKGENVEGMLNNYFKKGPKDYSSYLDHLTKESPSNNALKTALESTALTEVAGVHQTASPAICYLNSKKVPRVSKIRFVEESITGKNPMLYAPAIANWVSELKDKDFIEEEWEMLDRITWSRDTKETFINLAQKIKNLPVIQASIWEFAMNMRWITEKEYEGKLYDAIVPYFADKKITRAERDVVCNLGSGNENHRVKIDRKVLGISELSPDMVTALACLGNVDPDLVASAEKSLLSKNKDTRENGVFALYIFSEFSKFRDFSFAAIERAEKKETDHGLKMILQILEGRADGGLDLNSFWKQQIALFKTVDLTNEDSANNWYMPLYSRPMPREMIEVLLDRVQSLKEIKVEDRSAYVIAYVGALLARNADTLELTDAILAREDNEQIRTNLSAMMNDPDEEDRNIKEKGKTYWTYIRDHCKNETLRYFATYNLEKLAGLHRD